MTTPDSHTTDPHDGRAPDETWAEKDQPLREDIRLLGRLLGDIGRAISEGPGHLR